MNFIFTLYNIVSCVIAENALCMLKSEEVKFFCYPAVIPDNIPIKKINVMLMRSTEQYVSFDVEEKTTHAEISQTITDILVTINDDLYNRQREACSSLALQVKRKREL